MTTSNNGHSDNDVYAQELHLFVAEFLGSQIESLSIEISDEGIVIKGTCHSYHVKQLAQEVVSKSTSRRIVSNLIVVRD